MIINWNQFIAFRMYSFGFGKSLVKMMINMGRDIYGFLEFQAGSTDCQKIYSENRRSSMHNTGL